MSTQDLYKMFIDELYSLGEADKALPTFDPETIPWSTAAADAFASLCDELDRTRQTANEELAKRMQVRDQCLLTLDQLYVMKPDIEAQLLLDDLKMRLSV